MTLRHRDSWRLAVGGGVAIVWLAAEPALASNTAQPRVPVSFLGTGCVEVIDRSVDPSWHFDVGIPYEDLGLTEDEPPDGRRFQFFALCRQPGPLEELPLWISAGDVEVATMFDPTIEVPSGEEVLESASAWVGCVEAITTAEQRMPISCEATAGGVSWDASGVAPGGYAVWGYTYEPPQSLWTPRDGVIRVIDGDEASAGPAVSLSWPLTEVTAGLDAGIVVAGCVSGMPGTTVTLSWATAVELDTLGDAAWQSFAVVDAFESDGTFEAGLVPPASAEYAAVFLRAVAEDPQGRTFVAHGRERVVFLGGCDEPEGGARVLPDFCEVGSGSPVVPEGSRRGDGCEASEPGTTGDDGSDTSGADEAGATTGDTGAGPAASDAESGCGCRADRHRGLAWAWLPIVVLARRRRR